MKTRDVSLILLGFILGCICASLVKGSELQAARLDLAAMPASEQHHQFYFGFEVVPEKQRDAALSTLRFVLASASRQTIADLTRLHRVSETLFRFDARDYLFDSDAMHSIATSSPYHVHELAEYPAVIHPTWFIASTVDATESDHYERLLYNKSKVTRAEFLKAWGANLDGTNQLAVAEGNSAVSVSGVRWIVNYDSALRADIWGTLDFFSIQDSTDPLSNLQYSNGSWLNSSPPQHDGEEWIVGKPYVSTVTGEQGRLQVYGLFTATGQPVNEAPGRLVRDSTNFRGHGVIVNFGGCVQCHGAGLNPIKRNELAEYLKSGGEIYTDEKAGSIELQRRLLQNLAKQIARANEDYEIGVKLATGLTIAEFQTAWIATIQGHDAPLSLDDAARELRTNPQTLRLAIADAENYSKVQSPRLVALANGGTIHRSIWESHARAVAEMVGRFKE